MTKKDKQIEQAQARIKLKLDILRDWAEKGIPKKLSPNNHVQLNSKGEVILEFFPQSIRALRYWTGKECSAEVREKYQMDKLKTTSDKAWKGAPSAYKELWEGTGNKDGLMYQLKARARLQQENNNVSRLRELKNELASVKLNLAGSAYELIQLRIDNNALIEDIASEKAQHESTKLQFKIEIEWRDNQNKSLKKQLETLGAEHTKLLERYIALAEQVGEFPNLSELNNSNIVDFPEKN